MAGRVRLDKRFLPRKTAFEVSQEKKAVLGRLANVLGVKTRQPFTEGNILREARLLLEKYPFAYCKGEPIPVKAEDGMAYYFVTKLAQTRLNRNEQNAMKLLMNNLVGKSFGYKRMQSKKTLKDSWHIRNKRVRFLDRIEPSVLDGLASKIDKIIEDIAAGEAWPEYGGSKSAEWVRYITSKKRDDVSHILKWGRIETSEIFRELAREIKDYKEWKANPRKI